jgi:hypothetical protein
MRLRRCAAALSTAFLVAFLGGGSGVVAQAAGGATEGPDLSTPEAAKAYLISQGFDPSKFIFQVGLKNYSGPSCPGLGWNCTTANLVVQIATAGGTNYAECAADARQCVIVQGANVQLVGPLVNEDKDVNMYARCNHDPEDPDDKGEHMRLHESGAQECTIEQINTTTGNNHAVASMLIQDNDGPDQFGQQDAVVTQSTKGDGDNRAVVHEAIVLDTHDESTGIQIQDGFQSLVLKQDVLGTTEIPATGDNYADVKETQKITAHAQSDGSVQLQQTRDSEIVTQRVTPGDPCKPGPAIDANSCVRFDQSTGTGKNTLDAHMDHNVAAIAQGTGARQEQGCMDTAKQCGLELDGTQVPVGSTNTVDDNQTIHYTLNGPEGTTQIQDPPIRNGPGEQVGSPNDLWEVDQLAVLEANDADDFGDLQAHVNEVNDTSMFGTVDAQSVIILNGEPSEIVCNGSSCNYTQSCANVEGFFEGNPEILCPAPGSEFSDRSPGVD